MWLICRIVDSKTERQLSDEKFKETDESYTFGGLHHTLEHVELETLRGVYLSESGRPSDP